MSRLETQINQIFLLHPQSKKISLVLHEEKLGSSNHHLFLLAELKDDYKKINQNDLKNISEIILHTFRANKRLPTNTLFETSLSEINQRLADTARKQSRSWLGKFSSTIALKYNDTIYLAGSGATTSYLVRNYSLSEIWMTEKRGSHPLKTYQNFISGRLLPKDELIITTSSIFNFISAELFNKVLSKQPIEEATRTFSKILQDSASLNSGFARYHTVPGFACFLLGFKKEKTPALTTQAEILLPQQEELKKQPRSKAWAWLLKLGPIRLIRLIRPTGGPERSRGVRPITFRPLQSLFANRSPAGKFFLTSFLIFLLLFGLNLTALSIASGVKKKQTRIDEQINKVTESISLAESALIYKNDEEASKFLVEVYQNHSLLKKLDEEKSQSFEKIILDLSNKINRISTADSPQLVAELRNPPIFITRAGEEFLFATEDRLIDLFLLNTIEGSIRGILHVPNLGSLVLGSNKIYRINEKQKLFETALNVPNTDLYQLKFVGPNRLYTFDKNSNQILRITLSNQILSAPAATLKNPGEFQDFGVDSDVYLLVSDGIKKFVGGKSIAFNLQTLSDPLTTTSRLQVGNSLYILEGAKKRLLVFSKQGKILNQIYFPNSEQISVFYVDETGRTIYLVDGKKLLKITF